MEGESWMDIRSDHPKGMSYTEIGRRYHIDPRTAKRYAESDTRPVYSLTESKPSKLDPYKEQIVIWLEEAPYSALRIWEKVKEHGFDGCYTTVKHFVRGKKEQLDEKATVRFETMPGLQAQVDWAFFEEHENCIPLCLNCHSDMGRPDPMHAKGKHYSEKELIELRDKWYDIVSRFNIENTRVYDKIGEFEKQINNIQMQSHFENQGFELPVYNEIESSVHYNKAGSLIRIYGNYAIKEIWPISAFGMLPVDFRPKTEQYRIVNSVKAGALRRLIISPDRHIIDLPLLAPNIMSNDGKDLYAIDSMFDTDQ